MIILGIESSCDETAAAVVEDGRIIKSNIISSQIEIHRRFGGVVPEVASRNHTMAVTDVIAQAVQSAGITLQDLDAVAVTKGGGLIGALLVGVSAAKTLAYELDLPLIAVNHTMGHIAANYLVHPNLKPPYLCLVVSGGHTVIVRVDTYTEHTVIATTVDDSIGEAFDKVARKLGLRYPGGPEIDRCAVNGQNKITFLKKHGGDPYRFSYSGLKTAVINYLHKQEQANKKIDLEDVCASFTHAACDPLIDAVLRAAKEYGIRDVAMAGGVAANSYLRQALGDACAKRGYGFFMPPPVLCTDNAAMIAALGYYNYKEGVGISDLTLNASSSGEGFF